MHTIICFHFMFPFTDLFNCSLLMLLNSFQNMYSGMRLPSLPVSILYGISKAVSPHCISKCAIISDHFLFKYNESMLSFYFFSLGVWPNLYFHFMHCAVSLTPTDLPKVPHLAACGACFTIHWTLSGCVTSPTVPAWPSPMCCNV